MASRGNEETYGTQVVEAADASIGLNITGGVVFFLGTETFAELGSI